MSSHAYTAGYTNNNNNILMGYAKRETRNAKKKIMQQPNDKKNKKNKQKKKKKVIGSSECDCLDFGSFFLDFGLWTLDLQLALGWAALGCWLIASSCMLPEKIGSGPQLSMADRCAHRARQRSSETAI